MPARATLPLVEDGKAKALIVIPDQAPAHIEAAARHFASVIEESTGALLPVHTESALPAGSAGPRLFVGDTRHAAQLGLQSDALEEEAYKIEISGNEGIVIGHDLIRSDDPHRIEANSVATRWALNHLLETHVGVRWLWPGKLGTYIPKHRTLTLPDTRESAQPRFILRRQRIPAMIDGPPDSLHFLTRAQREKFATEALQWQEAHQGGQRSNLLIKGQPFLHWWDRYGKTHPDYFAELPPPLKQPYQGRAEVVKLRLSNPAVLDQIAREYTEAGKPDVWKISPNDGGGFDTSEETRAWDLPPNQSLEAIVYSEANLTARYIQFWNLTYERLSSLNPKLVLNSLAYASYRFPPPKERPLKARMILSLVPSYTEYDLWKGWADTGSMLILRPNWWCAGGGAPLLPIRQISSYFRFCASHGLVGFDFDSLMGYWPTQGFAYYLVARLGTNPELTDEQILDEYASAFGKAAPTIKEYLRYWEAISDKAGYSVHVGGHSGPDAGGEFERIVKEKGISDSPWVGSLQILPYLYTDERLAPAEALLQKALAALEDPREETERQRVAFLRKGLEHLRLLRDTMESGMALNATKSPSEALRQQFEERSKALHAYRARLADEHVIWPEHAYNFEERAQQPTVGKNLGKQAPDWRGE